MKTRTSTVVRRLRRTGLLVAGVLICVAATTGAAVPTPPPVGPSTTKALPGVTRSSYEGVKVVNWGYTPGGAVWQTAPLDASIPANRNASSFRPASSQENAAPNAVGFICSLYVGNVTKPYQLNVETDQTCSGAFRQQHIQAKFQHDSWAGWAEYSSLGWTSSTNATALNAVFAINCNLGNDKNGSYLYRGWAYGTAQSSEDGTWHNGQPVWSGTGVRYSCGSGNT